MDTDESSGTLAVHRLPLYNPSRLKDAEIIAAFAVRKPLLERIVADLDAEKPQSRPQHHLIVGQRGMGKTLLLARIAAELRSGTLKDRFMPLVFAEEQYAIDRLSKFWLNCLDSLADEQDRAGDKTAVRQIDAIVQGFTARLSTEVRDADFANEVLEAFLKTAAATKRRAVLLVDNLQIVFERLSREEQHRLRELLMRPGCPILVGASPRQFSATQDYGAAFYDHFKVHYLRPLSLDEMQSVLLHLSRVGARDDVRQRVLSHPERLAVLRQLTGGNPRTTVTLFFLYAEDFSPTVFGDLENLLDRVTPLYKAIFEELSPQQQVLASAIANYWDPITSRILAENTGLAQSQISPQLDRLEKNGFIEKVELFKIASAGYQIAERFFNVWFLMRSASRRQRREVEFLTRFIQSVYEAPERDRLARHLMHERDFSSDRYLLSCAVADSLPNTGTAEELKRHAQLDVLRQESREARRKLAEILDLSTLPPATLAFDQLRRKIIALVPPDAPITPEEFVDKILGSIHMFQESERERLSVRAEPLSSKQIATILEAVKQMNEVYGAIFSEEAVAWFSSRLRTGQLRSAKDIEDWNRAFMATETRESVDLMVYMLPNGFGTWLSERTIKQIRRLVTPPKDASGLQWCVWAYYLHEKLAFFEEAEAAYREAIGCGTNLAFIWNNFGNLLCIHFQRYDEAEVAYRKAIASDDEYAVPWNGLGNLFCDHFNRFDEAADAYTRAIELDPNNETAYGNLLFLHRDFLGEGTAARPLLERLVLERLAALPKIQLKDTLLLQEALFHVYEANWGLATAALTDTLELIAEGFPPNTTDDWMRASAVLLHLNYGAELLAFLEERGENVRLRPWYEALKALHQGDRQYLKNIAPEIRTTAEAFYDQIERRLNILPESTRRRPLPGTKKPTKRKSSRG